MSQPPPDAARMKTDKYCPVSLEPELEEIAALWPPVRRLEAAAKMRRWARQLEISARVMVSRARPDGGGRNRRRPLPVVARRKLMWN